MAQPMWVIITEHEDGREAAEVSQWATALLLHDTYMRQHLNTGLAATVRVFFRNAEGVEIPVIETAIYASPVPS